jgi:hypothetical protein
MFSGIFSIVTGRRSVGLTVVGQPASARQEGLGFHEFFLVTPMGCSPAGVVSCRAATSVGWPTVGSRKSRLAAAIESSPVSRVLGGAAFQEGVKMTTAALAISPLSTMGDLIEILRMLWNGLSFSEAES